MHSDAEGVVVGVGDPNLHLSCKNASSLHRTNVFKWASIGDTNSFVEIRALVFGQNICVVSLHATTQWGGFLHPTPFIN